MKNKKGFTLIEIVATLGLISIILIIAIPVISNIRKSIMVRELESKKEAIVSAAEVYAQNNQSLFPKEGGIIQIPVRTLVYYGYINEDSTDCDDAIGCVMNPVNNTSMNNEIISIKKIKSVTQATFGEVNEHVITFHANGATSVGGSSNFISIGCDTFTNSACTIRVPSIERDEFTKVGFGESANSTTANYLVGQDILFNDNISNNDIKSDYYAITSKDVIVTFNASTNGGTLTTGVGTLDKNCTIQNQQNTCSVGTSDPGVNDRAGYIRKAGWYNNSSGGNVVTTRSFSSNQTLYAQWDACQKGYYALAGATSCTACSVGAYSASIGSSSCAVCGAGKTTSGTGTQASSSCTDCSNKAHVATWETPTWSPNSVTNLCKIKTCESGYRLSNNTCVPNCLGSDTLNTSTGKCEYAASFAAYSCPSGGTVNSSGVCQIDRQTEYQCMYSSTTGSPRSVPCTSFNYSNPAGACRSSESLSTHDCSSSTSYSGTCNCCGGTSGGAATTCSNISVSGASTSSCSSWCVSRGARSGSGTLSSTTTYSGSISCIPHTCSKGTLDSSGLNCYDSSWTSSCPGGRSYNSRYKPTCSVGTANGSYCEYSATALYSCPTKGPHNDVYYNPNTRICSYTP